MTHLPIKLGSIRETYFRDIRFHSPVLKAIYLVWVHNTGPFKLFVTEHDQIVRDADCFRHHSSGFFHGLSIVTVNDSEQVAFPLTGHGHSFVAVGYLFISG